LPYKYYSNNNAANLNRLQSLNIFTTLDVNNGLLPLSKEKSKIDLNNGFSSSSENNVPALAGSLMSKDRLDVVLNNLFPHSLARTFSGTKQTKTKKNFFAYLASLKNKNNKDLNHFIDPNSKVENPMVVLKTKANGQDKKVFLKAKSINVLNIIRYK
jgi:hypothetical protein